MSSKSSKKFIFLDSKQVSNYHHAIIDFLPIIHEIYKNFNSFDLFFDLPNDQILLIEKILKELYKEKTINVLSSFDPSDKVAFKYEEIKNSINEELACYLKQIRSNIENSHKKIIIKRNNRYISKEILDFLAQQDFVEIFLENYSVEQQANIMYNADCVVASHGAGLTNIIFCSKKTKILELNNGFNSNCYKKISKFCEGKYHLLINNKHSGKEIKNNSFEMSLDFFKKEFYEIFSNQIRGIRRYI